MSSVKNFTLKQLEDYLKSANIESLDENFLKEMQNDERVGVKKLFCKYKKIIEYKRQQREQLRNLLYYEQKLHKQSIYPVAGIDEAGRGPLAGPVFAAAVILPLNCNLLGIKDSKQLTKSKREKLFEDIKENALAWSVGYCHAKLIDNFNILEATKMAMMRAVKKLSIKPAFLLIDGLMIDFCSIPQIKLIKGEDKSASIAAASIIAKVCRDRYMEKVAQQYPGYKFDKHKGYPTSEHYKLIQKYGPCPEHRLSFSRVIK